jgi:hypothetical protein
MFDAAQLPDGFTAEVKGASGGMPHGRNKTFAATGADRPSSEKGQALSLSHRVNGVRIGRKDFG